MDYRIIGIVKKFFGTENKAAKPRVELTKRFEHALGLTRDEADTLINTLVSVDFLHESVVWSFNRERDSVHHAPGLAQGPKPAHTTTVFAA